MFYTIVTFLFYLINLNAIFQFVKLDQPEAQCFGWVRVAQS